MIRRMEIAQFHAAPAEAAVLDEPTVWLDRVAREAVWDHLRQLRARCDTTIVTTTHYMEEAEAFCSRMGILRAGQLGACGTLDELRSAAALPGATQSAAAESGRIVFMAPTLHGLPPS